MNRRSPVASLLVSAAIVAIAVAGCARPAEPPVELPSGVSLVVEHTFVGGFVPQGYSLIEAPMLAVYSDGRAIAQASRVLTLSQSEVSELVAATRSDLSGLGPTVDVGASQHVADAPTTVLKVLDRDGNLRSVSAYALGIAQGYPDRLVAADQRMRQLADRVTRDGSPYTTTRIMLVAVERGEDGSTPILTWPPAVPVPAIIGPDSTTRRSVLAGDSAAALIQVAGHDVSTGGAWPVLRADTGLLLGVAWRYLLPDE
jgi:hypothetical protein